MKPVIFYRSIFGGTRKVANRLAELSEAKLLRFADFNREKISDCGTVVVMSGTYGNTLLLVPFLKNHIREMQGHKLVIVSFGAIPEGLKGSENSYRSIPEDIRKNSSYFRVVGKIGTPEVESKLKEIISSL